MSREQILKNIGTYKPQDVSLPQMSDAIQYENKIKTFRENLDLALGESHLINDLNEIKLDKTKVIYSAIPDITSVNDDQVSDNHSCRIIDFCLVQSNLGVSENGAIWLDDSSLDYRSALFLAQNLIVVIKESDIVNNMHEAYNKINLENQGYGVFVAGPSKTADIEQSLVMGAHGARTLTIYIKKEI